MFTKNHKTEISKKGFTIINNVFSDDEINQIINVIESIDTSVKKSIVPKRLIAMLEPKKFVL